MDYSKYDINKVLKQNLTLRKLCIINYFIENSHRLPDFNRDKDIFKIYSTNELYEYVNEDNPTTKDNLQVTLKSLSQQGYFEYIKGIFQTSQYGFTKAAIKLTKKSYDLLKK